MSLKDRLREPDRPKPTFTCAHYDPPAGSRRCRHYLDGGACERPDEFMCVEWLKANGHPTPAEPSPPSPGRDRQDRPTSGKAQAPAPCEVSPRIAEDPKREVAIIRNLTTDEIASFKALQVEVCLRSEEIGEVWLVPEYTSSGRSEISVEHAATLTTICAAFPGAKVVSFQSTPPSSDGS